MSHIRNYTEMRFKKQKFEEYGMKVISLYRTNLFTQYGFYEDLFKNVLDSRLNELGVDVKELKGK